MIVLEGPLPPDLASPESEADPCEPDGWSVRQSTRTGALRVVFEGDERGARIAYSIRRMHARKGVYTEILRRGELFDAEISERAHTLRVARGSLALRAQAKQPSLF